MIKHVEAMYMAITVDKLCYGGLLKLCSNWTEAELRSS